MLIINAHALLFLLSMSVSYMHSIVNCSTLVCWNVNVVVLRHFIHHFLYFFVLRFMPTCLLKLKSRKLLECPLNIFLCLVYNINSILTRLWGSIAWRWMLCYIFSNITYWYTFSVAGIYFVSKNTGKAYNYTYKCLY